MCPGKTTARVDIFIHGQSGAKTYGKRMVDLTSYETASVSVH